MAGFCCWRLRVRRCLRHTRLRFPQKRSAFSIEALKSLFPSSRNSNKGFRIQFCFTESRDFFNPRSNNCNLRDLAINPKDEGQPILAT